MHLDSYIFPIVKIKNLKTLFFQANVSITIYDIDFKTQKLDIFSSFLSAGTALPELGNVGEEGSEQWDMSVKEAWVNVSKYNLIPI